MLAQLINQGDYKEATQKDITRNVIQMLNPYPIARGENIDRKKVDDSWEALRSGRF